MNDPALPISAGTKRKRVVLSIHDKQQVLQRLQSGEQPISIASSFGISRQQVSDIKKNRERILAFCSDAKHLSTLKRKTLKSTAEFHPGVEQELYRWIIRQRFLGRQVTPESMTLKTADLFVQYADAHMSVKAVANWLRHFKKAHGLRTMSEEEVQQLPDEFVPSMEMTQSKEDGAIQTDTATSSAPPMGFFASTRGTTDQVGASEVPSTETGTVQTTIVVGPAVVKGNAFVQEDGDRGQVQRPTGAAALQVTVNTIQQLNAQLARFDRDMAIKLDYLDERVTKLCYLVLPARLG